jgi:DNA-3-methyladenine glycosylase II
VPVLAFPQPYDFALSTERFRAFGPDFATRWHDGGLHRVVASREVRIEPARGGVLVEPLDAEIERELGQLLGLGFDLEGFADFAARDAVLAQIERRLRGFRPIVLPDPFEMLVGSITAQQVSLYAATAVRNRLIERFGDRAGVAYAFPPAERLARADAEELAAVGLSRRKAEYVQAVARAAPELRSLAALPDDDVKRRIAAIRGLGEWTADWFLARHLGRPRAWPAGDLGLRKAVSFFYGDGRLLTTDDVRGMSDRFAPFENLTANYLLLGLRVP